MSALEQLAGRRILFLNWRDLSNPAAGGAEAYAEQIARRFARAGALLTLFTSRYQDAPPHDWSNGYLVIRAGGRFGVYQAAAHHLRRYGQHYEAVVDFQNGIPFFAPLWVPASTAVVCVVHHVHQAQFDMYFRWPLSYLGRLLEGRVTRRVYRHRPFVAVSPSTRAEMRHQLGLREAVYIVPNGIDPPPPRRAPRSPDPSIAVVTRLTAHKQLHHLVQAVPELMRRWPELHVDIAGTGPARDSLLAQIRRLGLEQAVTMPGRVPEQAKNDLLSRAWLTVAPSLAEGWGLTVLEANALGTPAVAYDVPGLRDAVRDGLTGWLVPPGEGLATAVTGALEELEDPAQRQFYADHARAWAARFSWDGSAERLARVVLAEIRQREQGSPSRRRAVDLATAAYWPAGDLDLDDIERRLRKGLRVTDVISRSDGGLSVLLVGCDELGAAVTLRRAQVPVAGLRLCTTTEILCGTGEGDLR
jgi:glycosyltransferase involved in cell wall biosynthesis